MSKYGYPWPHIVRCDQFPVDNDMCIMAQHGLAGGVVGLEDTGKNSSINVPITPVQLYPDASGTSKGIVLIPGQKEAEVSKKRRKSKKNRKVSVSTTSTSSPFIVPSEVDLTTKVPIHVHHHLQTMTEQREISKDSQPLPQPPPGAEESGLIHSESKDPVTVVGKADVQDRILRGYCHSDWSLKVRAAVKSNPDGSIVLHVKSYRILWGGHGDMAMMRPSIITIPANVSQEITETTLSSFHESASDIKITHAIKTTDHQDKSRFYVMGSTRGYQYLANYAIPWPHKSPQFRSVKYRN